MSEDMSEGMSEGGAHGWAFRVASRPEDGGGHVARTLAIAEAMPAGTPVAFVLDAGGDHWQGMLRERGFQTLSADGALRCPWVGALLDGYHFSKAERAAWRAASRRLAVIEDGAARWDDADLVIRPAGLATGRERELAGADYALIRPAFARIERRPVAPVAQRVLVFFGRRDAVNATGLALTAIEEAAGDDWQPEIVAVLGADAPHRGAVARRMDAMALDARLVIDTQDMVGLLAWADMGLGAGGVGLLERCAAGLASVTLCLADNQRAGLAMAVRAGATENAGPVDTVDTGALGAAVRRLAFDGAARAAMSEAGRRLIDGKGAARVAEGLVALESDRPQPSPRAAGRVDKLREGMRGRGIR